MGDRPMRPAMRPRTPSPKMTAPSSSSSCAVCTRGSAEGEQGRYGAYSLVRAHHDHLVAGPEPEVRRGLRRDLALTHDRDDRRARAGADLGVGERPADVWGVFGN